MRTKNYQQGGVFDVKPTVPDVGGIAGVPRLEPPTVSPSSLPNVLSLLHDAEQRRYREQQRIVQEQSKLGADQDQYFALKDSIFGEVHNKQQEKVLADAKAHYGVKDLDSLALNNPNLLKPQIQALQMLSTDSNVKKVLGQAEGADRLRTKLAETGLLTSDEAGPFNDMWNEYMQWDGGPDGKTLFPNDRLMAPLYNKPKTAQPKDIIKSSQWAIEKLGGGVDVDNPEDLDRYFRAIAITWNSLDADKAKEMKLLTDNPNIPELSAEGQRVAMEHLMLYKGTVQDKDTRSIGVAKQKKENSEILDNTYDPEKTGKIKPLDDPKVVQSVWSDLVVIAKSKSIDLSGLDPNDPEVKPFLKVITTDGGSLTDSIDKIDDVAQELDTIKKRKEAEKLKGTYQDPFQALLNKAAQPAQDPATTVDPAPTAVKKVTPSFQSWKNKPK